MLLNQPIIMDNKNLRNENPNIQLHFDACAKELEDFPKESGVIVSSKYVEWIDCPVCNSQKTKQWMVKWGGRYDECENCSHVFVKNRFKPEILTAFYSESEADKNDRKVQLHSFNNRYWKAIYNKYMSFFWDEYSKDESILDVGCGSGQFIKYCLEVGAKNVYGLDVYPDLYEECGSFLPKENLFVVKSFEESHLSQTFKMIFLWGVLEHLVNPNAIFKVALDYLDENGKIFVLVPNIHSRARKLLGVHTPTINPRQHINFFTKESMTYLCEKHNLKIKQFEHELPIIDLMWPFIHDEKEIMNDINASKEGYYHIYILERN